MQSKRNHKITKYDNDTYVFINSLESGEMIKDTAKKIGVTYITLFHAYKNNRITYSLKKKIEKAFNLSDEQKNTLNKLVLN